MYIEGWKKATVGELCRFSSGHGFSTSDWAQEGLPIIRIQNLNGSRDFNFYAGDPDPSWIVEPGELLFAWAGVKGVSFGPTIWTGPRGLLNQHIYRVRPVEGVDLRWLDLQLQLVTRHIEANAHGFKASLVHVRRSDITGQVCYLPPEEEQKRIAEVVGIWSEAGLKLDELTSTKLRYKEALAQRLLTGQSRFGEFVRSSGVYQTKHGPRPLDWPEVQVRDFASERIERNGKTNGVPVLSCTKYGGLVDSLRYFGKRVFSENTSIYKVVRRGQFAYATNHIEEGSIGLLNDLEAGLVSPMYTVFCTDERVFPPFLYLLFKTEMYRRIFKDNTSASVDRRGSLRWQRFSQIRVSLPTPPEQAKISEVLGVVNQEIDQLRRQASILAEQKKGVLHKLMRLNQSVRG